MAARMLSPVNPPPLPPVSPVASTGGARWRALIILAAVAAAVVLLKTRPPTAWPFWPKCMLHEWTGWHCPGCGLSRAGCALLRGEAEAAFRHHPVFWLLALPWALYGLYHAGYAVVYDRVSARRAPHRLVAAGAFFFIIAGFLRNAPGFSFLGP